MTTGDSQVQLSENYNHARALFQQGRHQEALQAIQQLLWQHPRHLDLLLSKALCLQALGRPQEAAETAREGLAVKEDPRLRELLVRLEDAPASGSSSVPPVDAVGLLKRMEEEGRESPLVFLTSRRAYTVVFLLMFLLLACVGPMLWWGLFGRPVE